MVFDPTDLRNLGAVFDDAWDSILTKHPESQSVRSCVFGSRLWCFAWQRDHQLGQEQIKATALRILTNPALVSTG